MLAGVASGDMAQNCHRFSWRVLEMRAYPVAQAYGVFCRRPAAFFVDRGKRPQVPAKNQA